jgi:hypothetical protein
VLAAAAAAAAPATAASPAEPAAPALAKEPVTDQAPPKEAPDTNARPGTAIPVDSPQQQAAAWLSAHGSPPAPSAD